jgi:hypothetical protein
MGKIDPNKLAPLIALIVLAVLAVSYGYRLEIGAGGLKFENGQATTAAEPLRGYRTTKRPPNWALEKIGGNGGT